MSWFAQVRHVAWKDLRQSRWILSIYVVTVLAATARSLAVPSSTSGVISSIMLLVVLLGIAAVATLIQSDSPTRSDAIWATLPFNSSAMVSAKVALVVIIIIALPVIGQIIALDSFRVPSRDLSFLVSESALVYTLWLLATTTIAALTRDLRTFIVTFLGAIVVLTLATSPISTPPNAILRFPIARGLTASFAIVGGIALLLYLYRTHVVSVGTWIGAGVVVVGALATIFIGAPVLVFPGLSLASTPEVQIELMDVDRIAQWRQLPMHVAVANLPDSLAMGITLDTAVVHLRDGRTIRVVNFASATLQMPNLPGRPPTRWISGDRQMWTANRIVVPLSGQDARAVAEGISSVELIGMATVQRPEVGTELPLRAGASVTAAGTRARILRVDRTSDNTIIELQTVFAGRQRAVPGMPGTTPGITFTPHFALVNPVRHEAMTLYNHNSSGGGDWLVLPGVPIQESSLRLESKDGQPGEQVDGAWFRDAELVDISWNTSKQYRFHLQVVAPK